MGKNKILIGMLVGAAALGLGCGKPNPNPRVGEVRERVWEVRKDHNNREVVGFSNYGQDVLAHYRVPRELREMGFGLGNGPVDSTALDTIFSDNLRTLIAIARSPSFDSTTAADIAKSLGVLDSLLYHRHALPPGLNQSPGIVVGTGQTAFPDPIVLILNPDLYSRLVEEWDTIPPAIQEVSIGYPRNALQIHHLTDSSTGVEQIISLGRLKYEYGAYMVFNPTPGNDTNDVFGAYDNKSSTPDIVFFPTELPPEVKYLVQRYSPLLVKDVLEKHGKLGVASLAIFAKYCIDPECALEWVNYILPNSARVEKIKKIDRCTGKEIIISRTVPADSMFVVGVSEAIARGSEPKKALKFFKIARDDYLFKVPKEARDRIYQQLGHIVPKLKSEKELRDVVQKLIELNTGNNTKILEWLDALAYYGRIGSLADIIKLEELSKQSTCSSCKSKLDELEKIVKDAGISTQDLAKRANMADIVTLADSASKVDITVLRAYAILGENKGLNTSFSAQVLYVSSLVKNSQTGPYQYNNIVETIEANRDPTVAALLDTLKIKNKDKGEVYDAFINQYLSDPLYAVSVLFAKYYFGVKHFERYSDKAIRTIYPTLRGEYKRKCVIISADSDPNGALKTDKPAYDRLVDEGYGLIILEAASVPDLLSYLDKIREGVEKVYGKVDVILINAHGDNNSFILGESPNLLTRIKRDEYKVDKENDEAIQAILSILKPDGGTILFSSCRTGMKGGIAEKIEEMGKKNGGAIAIFAPPPTLTGIERIELDWSGRIVYVEYYGLTKVGKIPFYAPFLGRVKRTSEEIKRVLGMK